MLILTGAAGSLPPAGAAEIQRISAGQDQTQAAKTDGALWAWGWNSWGQVGDGTGVTRTFPVPVAGGSTWASFDAGGGHTAAVGNDGTLWAWGYNFFGQLGDGTTVNRLAPLQTGTDADWDVVAAGGYHTLALRIDGTLWAWGYNVNGQLGDGTTTDRHVPVQIGSDVDWIAISAGDQHNLALKSDGSLWAWGYNWAGQLGDGSTTSSLFPIRIGADADWSSISAGGTHSTALKSDNSLWAWGRNGKGQLGQGTWTDVAVPTRTGTDNDWAQVTAGREHTLARRTDGTLWAWGFNLYGRLGDGTETDRNTPQQIGVETDWAMVEAGYYHSAAIRFDGSLWTWGYNSSGQLGDNTTINRLVPTLITRPVAQAGPDQVLAATSSAGALVTLDGSTSYEPFETTATALTFFWSGAFGTASGMNPTVTVPIGIDTISLVVSTTSLDSVPDEVQVTVVDTPPVLSVPPGIVADATDASGAIVTYAASATDVVDGVLPVSCSPPSGSLFPIGSSRVECVATDGAGNTATRSFPVTVFGVVTLDSIVRVAAGSYSSYVVRDDGTLWAWGLNASGQLGDGTHQNRELPVQVGTDSDWAIVEGGYQHAVGLKHDGTLWAWGSNGSGQLGDGTTTERTLPVQVGADTEWVDVAAGSQHNLALKTDGTLWGWGGNGNGELGDGTTTDRLSPVQVGSDTDWVAVSSGNSHSLALKTDGSLWAWGSNYYGQLGDGSTASSPVPVRIGTGLDWSLVAAGGRHSLALRADGTLWGCGDNSYGQLGDGTTVGRDTFVQIGSDSDWISVVASSLFSVALKTDGTLWAWGSNFYGQLGDGSTDDRHTPVQVGSSDAWIAAAAGETHTLALKSNRALFAWGANGFGQLGDGGTTDHASPNRSGGTFVYAGPDQVVEASSAAGADVTLDGSDSSTYGPYGDLLTYTWSGPFGSATGTGPTVSMPLDTRVVMLTLTDGYGGSWADTVQISVVDTTPPVVNVPLNVQVESDRPEEVVTFTVTADDLLDGALPVVCDPASGSLFARGTTVVNCSATDSSGNTGVGSFTVTVGTSTVVSAGYKHTVAVRFDRTLWAWGYNVSGQLGDGTTEDRLVPVQIGASADWNAIRPAAGRSHTLALKVDGTLWAWGLNQFGQLGDGTATQRLAPVPVGADTDWAAIDAGHSHTVALKTNGTLWSWGYNAYGQLGDGTTTSVSSPAQVGTDTDWAAVAAGDHHTLALKTDGTLWAWGRNNNGQLGDGTTTNRHAPVQVGTSADWTAVAAGDYHTAALRTDGTLWTWGDNLYGQLGVSSSAVSQREDPAQVGSDSDWLAVAGGYTQSIALKNSRTLWNLTAFGGPDQWGVASDWVQISAGSFHSAAIKTDGTLWTWGFNDHGQLGNDSTADEIYPVQIWSNDADGDGIPNGSDPCPADPLNDVDSDGLCGDVDNCPLAANPGQDDADSDGAGDACDPCPLDPADDADSDGHCADSDNCPSLANPGQADLDSDGAGDLCDPDIDGDGIDNGSDNCPYDPSPDQSDSDSDGAGDLCDNCWLEPNTDQTDTDSDSTGDACDYDDDGDGLLDLVEDEMRTDPLSPDSDSDGFLDGDDAFPINAEESSNSDTAYMPIGLSGYAPAISGNHVVWHDCCAGDADIYLYDLDTGVETRITNDLYDQRDADVSGDRVVWEDDRNGHRDIYMYEISTGVETRITTDTAAQYNPRIDGNYIIWEDARNGQTRDVYVYDISTGVETPVVLTDPGYLSPHGATVSGERVIYAAYQNSQHGIYEYWISSGEVTTLTTGSGYMNLPDASGDMIVWEDNRNGNWDIYAYHALYGLNQLTSTPVDEHRPRVSAGQVIWDYHAGSKFNLDLYDFLVGTVDIVSSGMPDSYGGIEKDISNGRVVWMDRTETSTGYNGIHVYENDQVGDAMDNCPVALNRNQWDQESDGVGDVCDNCVWTANPDQEDSDSDGLGDACDVDMDSDGFGPENGDCDDYDPWLNPGDYDSDGVSTCDGDCDDADAGMQFTWHADQDSDGYTDGTAWYGCSSPPGYVRPYEVEPGDCDDHDPWYTPFDGDSDGLSTCEYDCDDTDPGMQDTWYSDQDSDGYTDGTTWPGCSPPPGYARPYEVEPGDCDDSDPWYTPYDGDSDGFPTCGGDCDDSDPGMQDAWYADQDSDGYTDGTIFPGCSPPAGYVRPYEAQPGDCNDYDPFYTPYDGDSDGLSTCEYDCDDADPGLQNTWYLDLDEDGYTDGTTWIGCSPEPGFVRPSSVQSGDCNDGDGNTHPDAPEVNDGWDNQCPGDEGYGLIDEISGGIRFQSPYERNEFSWAPQADAWDYEVARSGLADFSAGCVTFIAYDTFFTDWDPLEPGEGFYYLVRASSPYPGSWGMGSLSERTPECP